MASKTYGDQFADWLVEEGYTHCFFLSGGNIMHLLNSLRTRMVCVPVVHEVSATLASEYFNALRDPSVGRAFALVTAGPGVTNAMTGLAGAFLESRELLVVAGQVKSTDLADGDLRQRGIQEVNGCRAVAPFCKETLQIRTPVARRKILNTITAGGSDRKGPVFIEFCLDAQAAPYDPSLDETEIVSESDPDEPVAHGDLELVSEMLSRSERPVLLLGGGVDRALASEVLPQLRRLGIPIMTTWNGCDRIGFDDLLYLGRPDTWGMRAANLLIQQADLVIAVGARLSLQQTGFAWQEFVPLGRIVHVDLDRSELSKGHPRREVTLHMDAREFLRWLVEQERVGTWETWRKFGRKVLEDVPLDDPANVTRAGFISPYEFASQLSDYLDSNDVLIPCSSGGASTVLMQAFRQKLGQKVMNNKALASMGYGLGSAIGAALANPERRIILTEGDGGFAQNLQELGTVAAQRLNLKMFLFCNEGYASIRMTQRNYFDGAWIGCDPETGVGLPDWRQIASAYGIQFFEFPVDSGFANRNLRAALDAPGPALICLPIDPEQTYYPKISSRVSRSGGMESNPLHHMSPELSADEFARLAPFLVAQEGKRNE